MRFYGWILILLFNLSCTFVYTQEKSFFQNSRDLSKPRLIGTSVFLSGSWAGSITALSTVWYSEQTKTKFHFFDDSKNWLQMDKLGHVFSAHYLTEKSYRLFRWSGLDYNRSFIFSSIFGFGFQSSFEILDGYSSNYGFSWSDIGANAIGTGLFVGQEYIFGEQVVVPKFSYSPSPWADIRPEVLGNNFNERILKDYNGQTYWYSFGIYRFLKHDTRFPKWISISAGYSVNEKLVGDQETFTSNGETYESYRQFLFSMDIDLSKIPVKKPWLRTLLVNLNSIKVPFPAVEFSKHGVRGHGIYF